MATRKTDRMKPVTCLDCKVVCSPEQRCGCCIAIERDREER